MFQTQQKIKKNVYTAKKINGKNCPFTLYKNGIAVFTCKDNTEPNINDFNAINELIHQYEKCNNKEDIKILSKLIENFNMSMCENQECYVKSSYMSEVGKHAVKDLLLLALDTNGMQKSYVETLETYKENYNNKNNKLYMGKIYITRVMFYSIIKDFFKNLHAYNQVMFIKKYGHEKELKSIKEFIIKYYNENKNIFIDIVKDYNKNKKDIIKKYCNDIKNIDNYFLTDYQNKVKELKQNYAEKIENIKNNNPASELLYFLEKAEKNYNKKLLLHKQNYKLNVINKYDTTYFYMLKKNFYTDLYNLKRKFIDKLRVNKNNTCMQIKKQVQKIFFDKYLLKLSDFLYDSYIMQNKTIENIKELEYINELLKNQVKQ